jgi:hypothetical protein
MGKAKYLIFLALMVVGCFDSKSDKSVNFTIISIEESDIVIDAKTTKDIALPSFIRTGAKFFLIYDAKTKKIFQ